MWLVMQTLELADMNIKLLFKNIYTAFNVYKAMNTDQAVQYK